MNVGSIYEHTHVCTCTAKLKKNIFNFRKSIFLSLNRDDGYLFCTIGVFLLVFRLSFYYSIILTASLPSVFHINTEFCQ